MRFQRQLRTEGGWVDKATKRVRVPHLAVVDFSFLSFASFFLPFSVLYICVRINMYRYVFHCCETDDMKLQKEDQKCAC
jgi:hypothetical protein